MVGDVLLFLLLLLLLLLFFLFSHKNSSGPYVIMRPSLQLQVIKHHATERLVAR